MIRAALLITACGLFGGCGVGQCPTPEELPDQPVATGTYTLQYPPTGDPDIFNQADGHELQIDREVGSAMLSFTTAEGRAVTLVYEVVEERWTFPP